MFVLNQWRRGLFALLVLVLPASALALDRAKAITQFIHKVWRASDGLPQNTITAIAQTPDGYLWLGTREGLVRFDGVRFTVYTSETTPALAQSQILSLLADREGRLWIGTWGGGLTKLEKGTFSRFGADRGLPNELVAVVAQDRQGRIWVGTDGGGLARSPATASLPLLRPARSANRCGPSFRPRTVSGLDRKPVSRTCPPPARSLRTPKHRD